MPLKHNARIERFFGNSFSADHLFCGLSPKTLKTLTRIKQKEHFPKGIFICKTGNMPHGVYILFQGQAQLNISIEPNEKNVIRPVEPNEIIGLTETLANLPFKTNILTITPCIFEFIESDAFLHFLHDESEICFRLVQLLGLNLQKSYQLFCTSLSHKFL
jgi:CRP-like cAMP-binding protein